MTISSATDCTEWESMMNVSGYHGMPSFKVRPKALSRHGTQHVQEYGGRHTALLSSYELVHMLAQQLQRPGPGRFDRIG